MNYAFTIDVDITDIKLLRQAAEARYVEENRDPMEFNTRKETTRLRVEWRTLRSGNLDPIAADLHMLLDPGSKVLGGGGEITNTDAEDVTP